MLFISSSCLIAVTRTSNTMLNKSGEKPCLIPYLKENAFSFSSLSMYDVSYGFVINGLYFVEVFSLYSHIAEMDDRVCEMLFLHLLIR